MDPREVGGTQDMAPLRHVRHLCHHMVILQMALQGMPRQDRDHPSVRIGEINFATAQDIYHLSQVVVRQEVVVPIEEDGGVVDLRVVEGVVQVQGLSVLITLGGSRMINRTMAISN